MKRMICTLLAVVLLLSLAACSSGNVNSGKQTASAYLDQESDAAMPTWTRNRTLPSK